MIVVRDPGYSYGAFRVLQRTDGAWIVYSDAKPLGHRTLSIHATQKEAEAACRKAAGAKS